MLKRHPLKCWCSSHSSVPQIAYFQGTNNRQGHTPADLLSEGAQFVPATVACFDGETQERVPQSAGCLRWLVGLYRSVYMVKLTATMGMGCWIEFHREGGLQDVRG